MRRLLPLALLLAACTGRYGRRVPNALLEKLPYESRIELLEAENDLALAIDHLDSAEAEILRTRDALRRAKDQRRDAKSEVSSAADAVSKEVATLAVAEAEAKVEMLQARQALNLRREELQTLMLSCAQARFQAARLAVARKAKVEGSEKLDPKDFDEQVKACQTEAAQTQEKLAEPEKEMATTKDAWEQRRTDLAKKTFDARASPYVE